MVCKFFLSKLSYSFFLLYFFVYLYNQLIIHI